MRRLPLLAALLTTSTPALATEPWADPDPPGPPERYEIGAVGVAAEGEYRALFTTVQPISLNTEEQRNYNILEHRGRLGGTVDYEEKIKLTLSLDLLDSVLWGDNGTFGGDPSAESGLKVTTRSPNVARACMRPLPGGDPLSPRGYGFGLCPADPVTVRRLYAQVNTPFAALRVGRQSVNDGIGVLTSDGEGRRNRWGVAHGGDAVDRILVATKPLELLKPAAQRNTSETEGVILAGMYDRWASDSPVVFDDDVSQAVTALRYLEPDFGFGRDLVLTVYHVHRWNPSYRTRTNTIGGRLAARFGDWHLGFDVASFIGSTREVAEAYKVVTNDPVVDQLVRQLGARAVVRYDQPLWTAYLEADFASGDSDPRPRTPLTQFRFADDTNVGLLMFEHVLRFQSARAAAAGVEIMRRLGAVSFPAERIDTRGAFTDALAIFPQIDVRPHETVLLRGGVLVAWAPAPVFDQLASLQAEDGLSIEDDLTNFVGGKPGQFYGTEIDVRAQWRFLDHFALDLEGAVLFPGDAFEDINGDAVTSFLGQGRTTVYF